MSGTAHHHPGVRTAFSEAEDALSLTSVATLVLWVSCAAVAAVGWLLPYARPVLAAVMPPVVAEIVHAELPKREVLPPKPTPVVAAALELPPAAPAISAPAAPPPLAVAQPMPNIAFAIPVAAPARIVEAKQASYRTAEISVPAVPAPAAAPVARPLTFGQGEGKQPAPDYPRQAVREGQEGTVVVRLLVGDNGRVMNAEAASPSPWPLLNEAALRVVRQRWRFASGDIRAYEVAIHFQLNK